VLVLADASSAEPPVPLPATTVTGLEAVSTIEFPARRVLLLVIPGFLAVQALAIDTTVQVAEADPWGYAVLAGVVAAAVVLSAAVLQWAAIRGAVGRVRLEPDALVLPGRLHGYRRVPLAVVTGVGMQYVAGGRGSGWRPYVWLGDGRTVRLNIPPPEFAAPKSSRSWRRVRPGQAPPLDWDYVASSPAGRAAMQIGRRVLAVQGPTGAWRTEQRERRAARPDTLHTAFWSPSGDIGALDRPTPRH
jgi:hypothetical protein